MNDKYAEFAIPADLMREIPAIGMRWDGESLLVGLPDVFDDQEEAAALQKLAAVDLKNVGVIRVPDRELRELVEYTLEAASVRSEAQIAEIAERGVGARRRRLISGRSLRERRKRPLSRPRASAKRAKSSRVNRSRP